MTNFPINETTCIINIKTTSKSNVIFCHKNIPLNAAPHTRVTLGCTRSVNKSIKLSSVQYLRSGTPTKMLHDGLTC